MARTLSDTLIVAVLESATRLTGARGPIAGSSAAQGGAAATPPAGTTGDAPTTGATGATSASDASLAAASKSDSPPSPSAAEHDARTADQIAADFKTIYAQIEELVRGSAEQETKSVGFGRG